ncbi:hypothetical protein BGZ63DRAFT_415754 [Mariannaea sp. PMI_226]|nr:hypothetical protein BGZ63DRAFT_415754 [Mariannaea sp. PMI_226]
MPRPTKKEPLAQSSGKRPVRSLRITMPTAPIASPAPSHAAAKPVTEEDVNKLSISDLTIDTPLRPLLRPQRVPATPFHFLSLPSELRIKIYAYFFADIPTLLDLNPDNYKRIHKKLGLMRVCKQVHDEATYAFYSTRTFRLFPTYPIRLFKKKPLLARLKPHQRQCLTSLELRLGISWNAPPKLWAVNPALGLRDCGDVTKLKVYIDFDPSDITWKDFRAEGFYEGFCGRLMTSVIEELPSVDTVEFDARPCVKKSGDMMQALISVAQEAGVAIEWGPDGHWNDSELYETRLTASGFLAKCLCFLGNDL